MTDSELCTLKKLYKEEADEQKRLFEAYNDKNNSALGKYTESVHRLQMFNLILEYLKINWDEWWE